jgi:hypothetical protein
MAWDMNGVGAAVAAELAEREALMAYRRLRPMWALVSEAMRRAESAARLEAALRLSLGGPTATHSG